MALEYFKKAGIKHVFGIPGHGNAALTDVLYDMKKDMEFIPIKHEQYGGHMADGYFRANRKTPAIVTTSVGPGATNLATALATAYVDSSTFIALTGDIQTYLLGKGIFQEIERQFQSDYINAMRHFTKRAYFVTDVRQLPNAISNGLKEAVCGRPGPVLIGLPMNIQTDTIDVDINSIPLVLQVGRIRPDREKIIEAAKLLVSSERPFILVGGGVVMSDATEELVKLAELLGAPVATTFRGDAKGSFPETHELYVFSVGNIGNPVANKLASEADVILAIGVTFSDETTSSYVRGITFNIPPTKVIQIDIDPHEIGKNYPVEIGIWADAKTALAELYEAVESLGKRGKNISEYTKRIREMKQQWFNEVEELRKQAPMGIPALTKILRENLSNDTIITLSAGLPQEIFSQLWITDKPRTFISSGGFSTMGFALPAAIGAKLAVGDTPVIAIEGDGSFLMNNIELLTASQQNLPVITIILNNYGWISIRDLQIRNFEHRLIGTEFRDRRGNLKAPSFEKIAKGYGAEYFKAETPEEVISTVKSALKISDTPSVIEIMIENKFPYSGTKAYGYWDIPRRSGTSDKEVRSSR
ncbi:thiamine pyrophosphate-binding protein [Metallosphaera javensis (ex Sakai et al. 2022)]|uniref:thiamine pyrophosphate-binding protein n=1 Tax=Metallosphaera javensis (ex Sakai et al. 2022) TaxID=2775498 RepID=UPI00258C53FB